MTTALAMTTKKTHQAGIDLLRGCRTPGLLHCARGVVHGRGLVAQHQLRAFSGEQQRRGAADARACAGDDRHLAFEQRGHGVLLCARAAAGAAALAMMKR